jgi:hypothetical protein
MSRVVFGAAFKVLLLTFGVVLFMAVIAPLLVTIAGIAVSVMAAAVIVRWRIFRHRGW